MKIEMRIKNYYQIGLLLFLSPFYFGAAQAASLPLQKLAALCARTADPYPFGLWKVNGSGCPDPRFREMLPEYVILLPKEPFDFTAEAYLSATKDFEDFEVRRAEALQFADLFFRIRYPYTEATFFDLVLMINPAGTVSDVYGWENWKKRISFGSDGGGRIGCP